MGNLRVTYRDIAAEAGVSKATVSRALAGDPRVSPPVAERVRATATRLGYRPDPALGVLALHRWGRPRRAAGLTLAAVSNASLSRTSHPRNAYLQHLRARANALGYGFDHFAVEDVGSGARLTEILDARGIPGIVVLPMSEPQPVIDLDWSRFSVVECGRGVAGVGAHAVLTDHFASTRLAWRKCREYGYQRIGGAFFGFPAGDINHEFRLGAYALGQSELPPDAPRIPPFLTPITTNYAGDLRRWFDEHRPDCVIGLNDGVWWRFHEWGVQIPGHVAYCSLTASTAVATGCFTHPDTMSDLAVNWLDQMIRHHERGLPERQQILLVEPDWHDGPALPRRS